VNDEDGADYMDVDEEDDDEDEEEEDDDEEVMDLD